MIDVLNNQNDYLLADLNLKEANMSNADDFKAEVIDILNRENKKLILSMHNVNYIDSTFLGAMVAALKHAIGKKLDIILVGLNKDIYELMALIRLDKVFKIYDNFNSATSN
ncbi:STAS domain-containing protein [Mucilaginibacter ginkgonis]|uniref:STAS domain-containing protein n=1 Tax=Mucilaginibacter ginkgonis TaxID=2682091 RepID=A0A6I4I1Q8_9SPHI|nr:STAS domain-containing protein [Mucilaginibacter ginkgonis]QQL50888.1 STAS domain-containing protein [Mucilaginibacter ginkgonis]